MTEVPVLDGDAVLAAVYPSLAIERVRTAFERHATGEWAMPSKVYLDAPPNGDFRAMPARGDGFASLKWVTSFPRNSERGLPVVTGALLLSARVLGAPGASSVGVIGCGVNGAAAGRCLAAAGFGPGVCADLRAEAGEALADELGWRAGDRAEAAGQDVVVTVTPGSAPVVLATDLRPGQHVAALGADARGKAELEQAALARCLLFCDDWPQASAGGELSGAVAAGRVDRDGVTQIGDVILGRVEGRQGPDEITFFDSTGLAIQDLAIAIAVYEAWRDDRIEAEVVGL